MKQNELLKFDGKNIQTLTKNLIQLDILKNKPTHAFTLKLLMTALIRDYLRKNLEASFKASSTPLNEQID